MTVSDADDAAGADDARRRRLPALLSFGFERAHGSLEQRDREDASLAVLVQLPDGTESVGVGSKVKLIEVEFRVKTKKSSLVLLGLLDSIT